MEEEKNTGVQSEGQPAPGAVISPNSGGQVQNPQENQNTNVSPAQTQEIPVSPVIAQETPPASQVSAPSTLIENEDGFSWTGPEFAQQDKPSSWYVTSMMIALILGVGIYLLTKDAISSVVVPAAIIVLVFYSLRKPKDITYTLNSDGVTIGPKTFAYEEFRSFTATVEGIYLTVTFLPFRRFATTAGLYYEGDDKDEDKIVNFLSDRLPMEKHRLDIIESLMRRMRL